MGLGNRVVPYHQQKVKSLHFLRFPRLSHDSQGGFPHLENTMVVCFHFRQILGSLLRGTESRILVINRFLQKGLPQVAMWVAVDYLLFPRFDYKPTGTISPLTSVKSLVAFSSCPP